MKFFAALLCLCVLGAICVTLALAVDDVNIKSDERRVESLVRQRRSTSVTALALGYPMIEKETCHHDGKTYQYGEGYWDECNRCTCYGSAGSACTIMGCPGWPDDPFWREHPSVVQADVHSSSSTSATNSFGCEAGSQIKIVEGKYGNAAHHCWSLATTVFNRCNGKTKCAIPHGFPIFGDNPCPLQHGSIVTYMCEGNYKKAITSYSMGYISFIECKANSIIKIMEGKYGNCSMPADQLDACDGRSKCAVRTDYAYVWSQPRCFDQLHLLDTTITYICEAINECLKQPCGNGGLCTNLNGDFSCACTSGFHGKTCDTDINECLKQPCGNGGLCTNLKGDFSCACKSGFTGKTCDTEINECHKQPCGNGGSCTNLNGDFSCACKSGFTGKTCDTDINECLKQPCDNGGSCTNINGDFSCACTSGFTGKTCAKPKGSPPRITYITMNHFVRFFQDYTITCRGEGFPAPTVTWYLGSRELGGVVRSRSSPGSRDVTVINDLRLTGIRGLRYYHCKVENRYGNVWSKMFVGVR